jgi:hypothetical protein
MRVRATVGLTALPVAVGVPVGSMAGSVRAKGRTR